MVNLHVWSAALNKITTEIITEKYDRFYSFEFAIFVSLNKFSQFKESPFLDK